MAFGFKSLWVRLKTVISRELHANMSPVRAALSLALGIFIGFSPFYGLHTPIVIALAFLFRLNRPLALVAASTTILPFVPLWVAAGIFTGRMVITMDGAGHLVDDLRARLPNHFFDAFADKLLQITRHIPHFSNKPQNGQGHLMNALMQWFIGCSVLAVVRAIVTFVISYFIIY